MSPPTTIRGCRWDGCCATATTAPRARVFGRPVLVAVAERDSIVPARFGNALHAALGAEAAVVIAAAGHNDWIDRLDAAWWRDAIAFLLGDGG